MQSTPKLALITGANRGIGRAIAQVLAVAGYRVVGTARSDAGAQQITQALQDVEHPGQGLVMDVTDADSIAAAMQTLEQDMGMPSILVNNAGLTADNLFLRMQTTEWDKILDTNLTGAFRLMKACIRPMVKARWGRIINISSVVAIMGNAGQANYAAAKAGLIGASKSLAQEVASRGITVNVIAPGFIQSDMTEQLQDSQQQRLLEHIPMGRMGQPDEIAHAVLFLASDSAAYITGETLHVNGGLLMH